MHLLRTTLAASLVLLATGARASASTLADRSPAPDAFAPGEETVFQVRFLNLPTGEGRLYVGEPQGDIWPVVFQAKTSGVAGLIDVREHLVSYWDAATHLPRGMDLRAYEVGDYHVDSAQFDRVNHKANLVSTFNGRRTEKSLDVPDGVHDLTSAFMWLRLQPLAPGLRYLIPIVASSKQSTLEAEVLGREPLDTPAGAFQTVKVRVRTAFDGKFSTRRDSFLWLSDDSRHVLVRAVADFAVGSMVATIRSYRPGSGLALRK